MMRLAFSIPTNSAEEQNQLFSHFHDGGFEGLQLKGGQYLRYVPEPQRFRDEWGGDTAACNALICGGTLDAEGKAGLRRIFSFASAVGSERVIFCHGVPRGDLTPDDIRGFAHTLSALGQEAAQQGLALSLHHHYDQPVMHRDDMRVFFEAITPGSVGLTLDTAHLAKSGITDIAGVTREFRAMIDNVHLKDFAGGEFLPLGQGDINFAPVFAALHEIGYDGWLCADEESGAGVVAGMQIAHEFIGRHLPGETA